MISFGAVNITEKTKELMVKCLEQGRIGQSEYIEQFEEAFAKFLGVKYCIATCNGTTADAIALAVLKSLAPDKKKVIVPALTFIAQINAIYYNQLRPVFLDFGSGFTGEGERGVLCYYPVHLLGKPTTFYTSTPVVEDACEALGSKLNGRFCGTMGDMGTFSFFPSHTISTGEGGAIVTDNDEYATIARRLRNHGKNRPDDFKFDLIGFNGKMSSMQAVVGLGLIDELPELVKKRHHNYLVLGGTDLENQYTVPHGFSYLASKRDEARRYFEENGIQTRRFFSCIPTQEKAYAYLGYKHGSFPNAEVLADYGFYVPCHQNLSEEDVLHIKKTWADCPFR